MASLVRSLADTLSGFLRWSLLCESSVVFWRWGKSHKFVSAFLPGLTTFHFGVLGAGYLYLIAAAVFMYLGGSYTPVTRASKKAALYQTLSLLGFVPALLSVFSPDFSLSLVLRLCILVAGLIFDFVGFYSMAFSNSQSRTAELAVGNILGLIAFVLVKFRYLSVDPIWNHALAPVAPPAAVGAGALAALLLYSAPQANPDLEKSKGGYWFPSGLAWGGFLSLAYWLFTGYTVFPRWFLIEPFPNGLFVIAGLAIGLIFPFGSVLHLIVPVTAFICIFPSYRHLAAVGAPNIEQQFPGMENELHIGGAVLLAVFTVALGRSSLSRLSSSGAPLLGLTTAVLFLTVTCLLTFAIDNWHEVPYGWALRERHQDVLLGVTLVASLGGLFSGSRAGLPRLSSLLFLLLFSGLAFVLYNERLDINAHAATQIFKKRTSGTKQKSIFTPMGVDGMFGVNHAGVENFDFIAKHIQQVEPSVLGIINTEMNRPYLGNRDMFEFMKQYFAHGNYGVSPLEHSTGCHVLSRSQMLSSNASILVAPDGEVERACFIQSEYFMSSTNTYASFVANIENTNFDDRKKQVDKVISAISPRFSHLNYRPAFFIGRITAGRYGYNDRALAQAQMFPFTDNLKDEQMWIRYQDFNPKESKEIMVDDEGLIEFHHYGMRKKNTTKIVRTEDECRLLNTSSMCITYRCSWCQFTGSGYCTSPGMMYRCLPLGGDYLQAVAIASPPKEQSKTNIAFEASYASGTRAKNPVLCKPKNGKNCTWTVTDTSGVGSEPFSSHWMHIYNHWFAIQMTTFTDRIYYALTMWPMAGMLRMSNVIDYTVTVTDTNGTVVSTTSKKHHIEAGNILDKPSWKWEALPYFATQKPQFTLTLEIHKYRRRFNLPENPNVNLLAFDDRGVYVRKHEKVSPEQIKKAMASLSVVAPRV